MTTDQLLQEAIIDLQKRELSAETRHLVDEAAQLLGNGRDIEARALIEKAQAIAVPGVPSKVNGATHVNGSMSGEGVAQTIISRLSSRLAQDIASALTEAVEGLHRNFGAQMKDVASSLEGRLAEIGSQLKALPDLRERVDGIQQEGKAGAGEARERWAQLSASIQSLQEADQTRRIETEQFSRSVSAELETVTSRVTAQEERLQVLTGLVQDLSSKALSVAEQIDRQTGSLRSMQERQAHWAAALNAVLDGIAKLREPQPIADVADAG